MRKIAGSTVAVLLGLVLLLTGVVQTMRYQNAKVSGYEVAAMITEVERGIDDDIDGCTYASYKVYVDYVVDGTWYENVPLGKFYDTDEYYEGKTLKVVVNPNNPGYPMNEGGMLVVGGFVLTVGGIIAKVLKKRSAGRAPAEV